MIRLLSIGFLLLLASSCQYFDTEKISSETFYEEELKAIDWEDVDQYPAFKNCEHLTEKELQKQCFETTLSNHIYDQIASKKIVTNTNLNSSVNLHIHIAKTGSIARVEVTMDSLLLEKIPLLEGWLRQGIDSLPVMAPAYKRGIPVKTEFTLPVIIATN